MNRYKCAYIIYIQVYHFYINENNITKIGIFSAVLYI